MRMFTAVCGLLVVALAVPATGAAAPIDFEDVKDEFGVGVVVDSQYAASGVVFTGAIALTAGISLNEIELPPHSGTTAVVDENGEVGATFTVPVNRVEAFFTYYVPLTLQAFDASGTLLGQTVSAFSSNIGTDPTTGIGGDPGSSANERLVLQTAGLIARIVVIGGPLGGSFAMDDFDARAVSVPEPSIVTLVAIAVLWMARRRDT